VPDQLILPNGAAGAAARPGIDQMQPRTLTAVTSNRERPMTSDLQAAAEGAVVDMGDGKIEFLGEWFRLSDEIGLMPLMAFSFSAQNGGDSDDMAGMAALYALIRDTVDQSRPVQEDADGRPMFEPDGVTPKWAGPSDWMRFERHAINQKADGDDLMGFVQKAIKVISARPTKRHGDSSPTSPLNPESTRDDSPSPAPGGRTVPGIEDLRSVADFGPRAR
jgi:hypothetical protein